MRTAPPVVFPVGRFVWGRRIVVVLAAASMGVICMAWAHSGASLTLGGLWLMVWAGLALLCWRRLGRDMLPPGQLVWDGKGWYFEPHGAGAMPVDVGVGVGVGVGVKLAVLWDLGSAMLIGVQALQGEWPGWRHTWLSAAQMPAQWHGWRCAAFGGDIL